MELVRKISKSIVQFYGMSRLEQLEVCRHWHLRSDKRTVPSSVVIKGIFLIFTNLGLKAKSHILFSEGNVVHFFISFRSNGHVFFMDEIGLYWEINDLLIDFREHRGIEVMEFDQYDYRCGANQSFRINHRQYENPREGTLYPFSTHVSKTKFDINNVFNPFLRDVA